MSEIDIQNVAFEQGSLVIQYIRRDDVRVGGKVAIASQISISGTHPDYADDMDALYRKAQRVLANVLEDFEDSEPFDPDFEDDDEPRGMGDR